MINVHRIHGFARYGGGVHALDDRSCRRIGDGGEEEELKGSYWPGWGGEARSLDEDACGGRHVVREASGSLVALGPQG